MNNNIFRLFFLTFSIITVLSLSTPAAAQSIDFEDFIRQVLQYSHDLNNASNQVYISSQQSISARSNLLPRINASLNHTWFQKTPELSINIPSIPVYDPVAVPPQIIGMTPPIDTSFSIGSNEITTAQITLIQPVFWGGKIFRSYQIAGINENNSELLFQSVKIKTIQQAVTAYCHYVETEYYLRVALAAESTLADHASQIRIMVDQGVMLENDYAKSVVFWDNAKLSTEKAYNARSMAMMNLNRMIGSDFTDTLIIKDSLPLFEVIRIDPRQEQQLVDYGLKNRAELLVAKNQIAISEHYENIARARFFPDINFTTSFTAMEPNFQMQNQWETNWSVGINFSFSVFEGGNRISQLHITNATAEISRENYINQQELIELEIRQHCDQVNEAVTSIEISQNKLNTAQENLILAENRFHFGTITNTELLDAHSLKVQCEKDLIEAYVNYTISLTNLKASTGLLDLNSIDENIMEVLP
ncbi:MAG: TolC family protein [bacterium]